MKFLKNNMWTLISLLFIFTIAMVGDAAAEGTVFDSARTKLTELFKNVKWVVFILGGFGLVALAFQAIFGKIKWPWFAALAFGLALVAVAGSIISYVTEDDNIKSDMNDFSDSF